MNTAINLIPLILATLGLGIASFMKNLKMIVVAFVIWISMFVLSLFLLGVVGG